MIAPSGPVSTDDILTELRKANPNRNYPLNTLDADVLALAGKSGPPVKMPDDFWGKSSNLEVSSANGFGTANSTNSGGNVACSPSVTVVGETAGVTYLWSFTSNPGGSTLYNPTSRACLVSHDYARNASGSADSTLQCVVARGAQTVTKQGITARLEWSN